MTPLSDALSEARLQLVHPELARRVRAAAAELAGRGEYFRVAQSLRTYAEQRKLYAQGPAITKAKPGYSWHNFGLAVDCVPFAEGCTGGLVWNAADPRFRRMVDALKAQKLAWGGDWVSIVDPPHVQPAEIPVSPGGADRAILERGGGLQEVWLRYPLATVVDLEASFDTDLAANLAITLLDTEFWDIAWMAFHHTWHHAAYALRRGFARFRRTVP